MIIVKLLWVSYCAYLVFFPDTSMIQWDFDTRVGKRAKKRPKTSRSVHLFLPR